ncbi:NADH-ubiquinone oxidoreductase subunit, mitochondrial [Wickerhamiella sorbophila]|uniref:NADH dehydrogenase [ubiquinone] iron-sulfur protein 4, mitochondrial n=1 Tax=Wickerhamiella sorbophila TaxID=45607 RepID=A0A2T0FNH1_9ASCO|nr:NADH-ubiquinone oxidoreductase subunit, mitochondrial [Wickerhamiella sorbophila]PRT56527.1 NADH-ubiquinone oxidoreductase subunit, mitochondrial [Wickerhamiella sorbophila]
MFNLSRAVSQGARISGRFGFSTARMAAAKDNTLTIKPKDASLDVAELSGAPADLVENRVARIYQEAPYATQSGIHNTQGWRIDFDIVDRANRWEDHTIGYASSGDYMQSLTMKFRSKNDAVRFATNQGWDFYIQKPNKRKFVVKSYGDNFMHSTGPLKHIRTK